MDNPWCYRGLLMSPTRFVSGFPPLISDKCFPRSLEDTISRLTFSILSRDNKYQTYLFSRKNKTRVLLLSSYFYAKDCTFYFYFSSNFFLFYSNVFLFLSYRNNNAQNTEMCDIFKNFITIYFIIKL